jgi:prepilin-type N-terminal cleavage/methylation domain-containing protein
MMRKESGLTLVEVLASITILSIVGVIIWQIFIQGIEFSQKSVTNNRLQQEVNIVISTLSRIHRTSNLYTLNSSNCRIEVLDSNGNQKALFENDQLCYQAFSNGSELVSASTNPNEHDLNLEIRVYEKKNPSNKVILDTLLYKLKEGQF